MFFKYFITHGTNSKLKFLNLVCRVLCRDLRNVVWKLFLYTKLLEGQILRKNELAEYFDVNEKSIQRDLEDIRSYLEEVEIEEGTGSELLYDY